MEGYPNIHDILEEYASESSIAGMPAVAVKVEMYKHLEVAGAIHVVGAFLDDAIIGFITVLSPILPHYSALASVAESFFVAKIHRNTGAGLKLLKEAEIYAKNIGSCGLLVSAPIGGDLAEVLPRVGYRETNRVFFRVLGDE